MRTIALYAATWGTGIIAGLFVALSVAVMPGLKATDDRTFVFVMQRINVAIVNPLFLLLFLGSPVLLLVATAVGPERRWSSIALGLTAVALVVTFAVNIPLNNRLDAAGLTDPTPAREAFEHAWNLTHLARTLLMAASSAACLAALHASVAT